MSRTSKAKPGAKPPLQFGLLFAGIQDACSADPEQFQALGFTRLFVISPAGWPDTSQVGAACHAACWPDEYREFNNAVTHVLSQVSPAGAQLAGNRGLGLLSVAATTSAGFNALGTNWEIYERKAAQSGQEVSREDWAVVLPMHIAETRSKAFAGVRDGLPAWLNSTRSPAFSHPQTAESLVESGFAVIGTPRDATRQIRRLQDETGGFGICLLLSHGWADVAATQRSYELFAEKVMPRFQKQSVSAV